MVSFQQVNGYWPTLRELADYYGVCLGSIQTTLGALKRKGALDWEPRKARAFKVLVGPQL